MLKLQAIEDDSNSGSAYSFPTPNKWRACIGDRITFHSGKISILLGWDNHRGFLVILESDLWGVALYKSKLSQRHIICGSVDLETINWSDPEHSANINSVCIKLTVYLEMFSDFTTRAKLSQITKEKGSKKILANTPVDKSSNKVSVKYLYE